MRGKMDCYGLSDVGKVRQANQDQFLIADLSKSMQVCQSSLSIEDRERLFGDSQGKLLMVADGIGGEAAGDRASTLAIDSMASYLLNDMRWPVQLDERSEDDFLDDLKRGLGHCQEKIGEEAEIMPARKGMGTASTMVFVVWPRAYAIHAGNSRCYLLRNSKLKQITTDHTLAQQFVDQGILQAEDAETSEWANVLWNVVGCGSDELSPAVYKAELQLNDTLLLCTNGLTGHLSDDDIAQSLNANVDAKETCHRLVNAANEAGGTDNTTVVVARFRDFDDGQTVSEVAVDLDDAVDRDEGPAITTNSAPETEPVTKVPRESPDFPV